MNGMPMTRRPDYSKIRTTSTRAIRLKCMDCCCQQIVSVRECLIKTCPLWRYRMGKEQRDGLYDLAHPGPGTPVYEGSGEVEMASGEEVEE